MRRLLSERRKDQLATVLIRTGGLLVILVVVGIVLNIGSEALPLFGGAASGPVERVADGPALAAGSDPRRESVWVLGSDKMIRFATGDLPPIAITGGGDSALVAADLEIHGLLSAVSDDGVAFVGRIRFSDRWVDDQRRTAADWRPAAEPVRLPAGEWRGVTANADDDGNLLLAAWTTDGAAVLARWDSEDEAW